MAPANPPAAQRTQPGTAEAGGAKLSVVGEPGVNEGLCVIPPVGGSRDDMVVVASVVTGGSVVVGGSGGGPG